MYERLNQLENDLRSAVKRRSYAEIDAAAAAFCAQASEEWRALPPGDPRGCSIFEHLMGVLEWAQLMLRSTRASTAAELRRARLATRYRIPETDSGLRIDI